MEILYIQTFNIFSMVLSKGIKEKIIKILQNNPHGLNISEIVTLADIPRNTAGRYLSILLNRGQIEMRRSGKEKIYTISQKVPDSLRRSLSSEYVMQLESNLNILNTNGAFLTLLDSSEQDLTGKNIEFSGLAAVFEDDFSDLLNRIKSALSGSEWKGELAYKKRGMFFSCHIVPAVFDDGRKGVTLLLEDISEKKHREDLIQESETRLSHLIGNLPGMAFRCHNNPPWTMEYVSKGCYNLTGYEPSSFIGSDAVPFRDIILAADQATVQDSLQEAIARQTPFTVSFRICTKNGSMKSVCAQGNCIERSAGQPEVLEGFITDITERTSAEGILRESEEKFRTLFNTTRDMIALYEITPEGLPGRFIEVNDEVCRQLKISRLVLLSLSPKDIVPPEDWPSFNGNTCSMQSDGDGHATFETVLVTQEGTKIPVEMSSRLFMFKGQTVVLSVIRDISPRKPAAIALIRDETQVSIPDDSLAEASGMDRRCGTGKAGIGVPSFGSIVERTLISRGYAIEPENARVSGQYSLDTHPRVAIKESGGFTVRIGVAWQEKRCAADSTAIRAFALALKKCGLPQGIYASPCGFTADAITEAERRSVDLWDATAVLRYGSDSSPSGDAVVTFPLAAHYLELFSPCLLNRDHVTMTNSTLWYIPFRAGSRTRGSDQDGVLQQQADTIKFLINMLTGEVVTAEDYGNGKQYEALIEQFAQTDPATMQIPVGEGYSVSIAPPVLSEVQVRDTVREEIARLLQHCPSGTGTPPAGDGQRDAGGSGLPSLQEDLSPLPEVFVPQWDIEFQAGPRIYRRSVYAGTLTTVADPIMRCAACDQEGRAAAATQPAVAVCEECWRPFCKEHVIKCAVCETYLCSDHIRTCLSCGRHFCAEHAQEECDVAERYQRLMTIKRKPGKAYLRGMGVLLLCCMGIIIVWEIFSSGGDPISAASTMIFFGSPFAVLLLTLGIFAIFCLFLDYETKSDKTTRMAASSVLQHVIAPRTDDDTESGV